LELSNEVAPEELHHHDVAHLAFNLLKKELGKSGREIIVGELLEHLRANKHRRGPIV
jgi:hypothetical protein